MKITMLTLGSRGDAQPYAALGLGLAAAGHQVTLATHACWEAFVMDAARLVLWQVTDDFWAACQDADVVPYRALATLPAVAITEKLRVPVYPAYLQRVHPTAADPSAMMPMLPRLGPAYNQLTFSLAGEIFWQAMRPVMNAWRQERLGLSALPRRSAFATWNRARQPCFYGFSPSVVPRPSEWGEHVHFTGYWFIQTPSAWQPPPDLADFLASGPPPVFVGFGSMTGRNPEQVAELAIRALARAHQRGLLLTGWGGLRPDDLLDDVYAIDAAPFDWLFPRVAAVVDHGGAVTTAAGLVAGKPSIVVPFFADQHFWAWARGRAGRGAAADPAAAALGRTPGRGDHRSDNPSRNPGSRGRAGAAEDARRRAAVALDAAAWSRRGGLGRWHPPARGMVLFRCARTPARTVAADALHPAVRPGRGDLPLPAGFDGPGGNMNDTETLFRTLFWSLLGAIMVMRTVFTCRVRRAGERFLPDRQAIQREVRGAFAVRFVGFFVPLTFLVLYALNVPWLAGLALPLPPWLCWAGFALGVVSLAWWISTQIALVTRWSAQLQLREGHHLVTTGPYARVRHLLYTAMFGLVQQTIGPAGAIVGVDLSDAMLEQARQRIAHNGWTNVQWVCADASEFLFPSCVDAILSTYTLTLVPEPSRVVVNSCRALAPGGRLAILDMARPRYCPLWWRHVLFFLRAYGVMAEVLECRPCDVVQKAMAEGLSEIARRRFWFGFFYLCSGTVKRSQST